MRWDVLRNSFANVAVMGVSLLIGLFFTPFMVAHLGTAVYGLIPLVWTIFSWLTVFTLAVNWSLGRLLLIEEQRGNREEMNRVFVSTFWPMLLLLALLWGIGMLGAAWSERLIRIPAGRESEVRGFMALTGSAFILSLLSGFFEVALFCRNRFDLRAGLQLGSKLLIVGGVVAGFVYAAPNLIIVGWAYLGANAITLAVNLALFRMWFPHVQCRPRWFSTARFLEMLKKNAWVTLDQVGIILMLNMDLFLANRFFGAEVSGEYALAQQWPGILKAVMTSVTVVFLPTYMKYVAHDDLAGLRDYALKACRYVGVLLALPTGLVLGLSGDLLRVWLHYPLTNGPLLLTCLALPMVLNISSNPLYGVWQAFYKVRTPCLFTIVSGVLGVVACVLFVRVGHGGAWVVAVTVGVVFSLRNVVFSIWYATRLMHAAARLFYREIACNAAAALVVAGAGLWLCRTREISGWWSLILIAAPVSFVYGIWAGWRLLERRQIVAGWILLKKWVASGRMPVKPA